MAFTIRLIECGDQSVERAAAVTAGRLNLFGHRLRELTGRYMDEVEFSTPGMQAKKLIPPRVVETCKPALAEARYQYHGTKTGNFWSLFLPLGACYSLDALRGPPREWRPRVLSVGSVAYVVQLCLLYWFAGTWKTDPAWRGEQEALREAVLEVPSHAEPREDTTEGG